MPTSKLKTLQQRLAWAMENARPPVTQVQLVQACKDGDSKISSAAVAQWFKKDKPVKFIKPQFLFPIARRCAVNAEWLILGKGDPHKGVEPTKYSREDRALLEAFHDLPKEIAHPIRQMIEVIAVSGRESYATWSADMQERIKLRQKEETTADASSKL